MFWCLVSYLGLSVLPCLPFPLTKCFEIRDVWLDVIFLASRTTSYWKMSVGYALAEC